MDLSSNTTISLAVTRSNAILNKKGSLDDSAICVVPKARENVNQRSSSLNDLSSSCNAADDAANGTDVEQIHVGNLGSTYYIEKNTESPKDQIEVNTESEVERLRRELKEARGELSETREELKETRGELADTKVLLGDSRNEVSTLKALRKKIVCE